MAGKFICGGEKYTLGGKEGTSIALPVSISGIPQKIEAEEYTLFLKSTFHVTLVALSKIIEKHKVTIPGFIDKAVADFCEFTKTHKVDLVRYRNEFRFMTENDLRAVIVMCDISNLNNFFDLINKKYKLRLEHPPTHVTIYTLEGKPGIYLVDSEGMKKLTKPIKIPGLKVK